MNEKPGVTMAHASRERWRVGINQRSCPPHLLHASPLEHLTRVKRHARGAVWWQPRVTSAVTPEAQTPRGNPICTSPLFRKQRFGRGLYGSPSLNAVKIPGSNKPCGFSRPAKGCQFPVPHPEPLKHKPQPVCAEAVGGCDRRALDHIHQHVRVHTLSRLLVMEGATTLPK